MQEEPIFKIIKWNVIGSWAASENVQLSCAICKNDLNSLCNDCISTNDPSIICYVVEGNCRHVYHQQCLNHWFDKN